MLFTTATEWAALALTLLGGWLLGLASHPGGRKWRDRYNAERDAHAAYRRDMEGRFRDHDADRGRLGDADARIAELERERADLDRDRSMLSRADARIDELERERADFERDRAMLARADARVEELERENARLRTASPPAGGAAPLGDRPYSASPPMPLTRRMAGDRPRRGWFDWGPGGDPRAR